MVSVRLVANSKVIVDTQYTGGGGKKVSHYQIIKQIVLNRIRACQ